MANSMKTARRRSALKRRQSDAEEYTEYLKTDLSPSSKEIYTKKLNTANTDIENLLKKLN